MARKVNTKELNNPTPVIIGAGITEECYFKHLKNLLNLRVSIRPGNFGKTKKFLENKKWVVDMIADNRLDDAIGRAKKYSAGEGSYTNIYKAIEKIMGTK